ncbi:MAG: PilZ domain-containing protein [Roseibium sp.]
MHGFEHLQDQPDAEEEVLIVDFDNLSVVNGVVSNVSQWGCKITSVDAKELYKNIGIQPKDGPKLFKANVTSVKGNEAAVIFTKNEQAVSNKRREKRNSVSIPVKIADLDGITEITGTVVDAGKNGCRVLGKGLAALPEEVLLTMRTFENPVVAEFAWRNETSAGLRLLWDRTIEESEGGLDYEESNDNTEAEAMEV